MTGQGKRRHPAEPADPKPKELERFLTRALRSHCPPPHTLGEYRLGLLGEAEAAQVERHLAACPHCESESALLEGFLQVGDASPEPAGAATGERLPLREQATRWRDALAGLLAAGTIQGGRGLPAPAGLRGAPGEALAPQSAPLGAETGASMGLTFLSDEALVALQARPGPRGRYDLLVLVTPTEGSPGNLPVWLRRGPATVASTRTDPAGNAVFAELPAGSYDLAVQYPTLRFWVKGIRLGPGADPAEVKADVPQL